MNDFLQNLRSGHKEHKQRQRQPGATRKNADAHYLSDNERRKVLYRRIKPQIQNQYKNSETLNESIPFIGENISQIASCMERITESKEKLVTAQLEQYKAVETFFQNLNSIIMDKILPFIETSTKANIQKQGTASYAPDIHHTKDDVISTIKEMRKKRATFAEIAAHLKKQGIPTFSGRGEWHAQTIHRLCK
ncbi:MAG: hypothetical protein U9N77_13505 [Thermodesulfobacteriota bacterium]|nr:hypothetical protein [Thermodesulfobacteriota bacterium]